METNEKGEHKKQNASFDDLHRKALRTIDTSTAKWKRFGEMEIIKRMDTQTNGQIWTSGKCRVFAFAQLRNVLANG